MQRLLFQKRLQLIEQFERCFWRELVGRNGGHVYPMSEAPLQLLLDVKSAAAETYVALDEELSAYDDVFTRLEKTRAHYESGGLGDYLETLIR